MTLLRSSFIWKTNFLFNDTVFLHLQSLVILLIVSSIIVYSILGTLSNSPLRISIIIRWDCIDHYHWFVASIFLYSPLAPSTITKHPSRSFLITPRARNNVTKQPVKGIKWRTFYVHGMIRGVDVHPPRNGLCTLVILVYVGVTARVVKYWTDCERRALR